MYDTRPKISKSLQKRDVEKCLYNAAFKKIKNIMQVR